MGAVPVAALELRPLQSYLSHQACAVEPPCSRRGMARVGWVSRLARVDILALVPLVRLVHVVFGRGIDGELRQP